MANLEIEIEQFSYDIFSNNTCECGSYNFEAYSLEDAPPYIYSKNCELATLVCKSCGNYYHVVMNPDGQYQIYKINLKILKQRQQELREIAEKNIYTNLFCFRNSLDYIHNRN